MKFLFVVLLLGLGGVGAMVVMNYGKPGTGYHYLPNMTDAVGRR
jgi:hypothetical protein